MRRRNVHQVLFLAFLCTLVMSCNEAKEHTAPAIYPRDSVSVMTTWGVNTLISDSGVMRYRIVTEKWEVNQVRNPSRWIFEKGLLLEQFDEKFHIEAYIQSDTAYYYDQRSYGNCVAGCVCAPRMAYVSRAKNCSGTSCAMSSIATVFHMSSPPSARCKARISVAMRT